MFYTRDYLFDELKRKLENIIISEKCKNNKTVYEMIFRGHKAFIDVDNFLTKLDDKQTKKSDRLLEEFIYYIENNFLLQANFSLKKISKEKFLDSVYPVIRSTTFGKSSDVDFLTKNHTNETKIFYSLDLGASYKLITSDIISYYALSEEEVFSSASKNLKKLSLSYNVDEVAGNKFYFLNAKDGYDGSRILNEEVLNYFYKKIGGNYYLGIPNQDALIFGDIKNKKGLEIFQKIMVHFFTEGIVPITTITFKYDGKNLESLFIFVE